jgi:putative transcriptional regulator
LRGIDEAIAFARGAREGYVVHVPQDVDVRAIRKRLGLSQREFAARFGFRLDSIQHWERRGRRPVGAARAFLTVIDREPEAVKRALTSRRHEPRRRPAAE